MNQSMQVVHDVLPRLLRIMKARLDGAESALQRELTAVRSIEAEIRERQATVEALERDRLDIKTYLAGVMPQSDTSDTHQSVSAADYRHALDRCYWVDYDSQREDYYLGLTHEEHRNQMLKVDEARQRVKALRCKYQHLKSEWRRSQYRQSSAALRKQEPDAAGQRKS